MFTGNSASTSGGGMLNIISNPLVNNCTFENNSAGDSNPDVHGGGGMLNSSSSPTVTNCTFVGNWTTRMGGGMDNIYGSSPIVTNCAFRGNSAFQGGGMRNLQGSSTVVTNCVFAGNSADSGGGMHNDSSLPKVTNCTFRRNTAAIGSGIYDTGGGATVTNSILWGNSGLAPIEALGGTSVVNYSIVELGWTGIGGLGVLDADPLFVDADGPDAVPGTYDDNLQLLAGSPAIDAGSNAVVPADLGDVDYDGDLGESVPLDLGRDRRFVDDPASTDAGDGKPPIVDMGAFEFQPDCDRNGVSDNQDIDDGTSTDCNNDSRPDKCEIAKDSIAPGGPFFCALDCDPDCNNNGLPDACEVPQNCEPPDCPVTSAWVGQTGVWTDDAKWCLPEAPNNSVNATFNVTIDGPDASVTLNISPTADALSLLAGATVAVDDASGANVRTLASDGIITNRGTFRATDRERFVLDAPVIDQGPPCGGGVLEATDGISSQGEGNDKSILEINGAHVIGGTARTIGDQSEIRLIGGAELADVCIGGVVVPDGQNGGFQGDITNEDVATVAGVTASTNLAPTVSSPELAVVNGSEFRIGKIRLLRRPFSKLGDAKSAFTNGNYHRIEGAGIVIGGLTNNGVVSANVLNDELVISTPGRKINNSVFEAMDGGTLRIADAVEGTSPNCTFLDQSECGDLLATGGAIRIVPTEGSMTILAKNVMVAGMTGSGFRGLFTLAGDATLAARLADIGPNGTVRADMAMQPNHENNALIKVENLSVHSGDSDNDPGGMSLTEAMSVQVTANARIGDKGGGIRPPCRVYDSASLSVGGTFYIAQTADLTYRSTAPMILGGNFENQSQDPLGFDWLHGAIALAGLEEHDFEVAGINLGPTLDGFRLGQLEGCSSAHSNFAMRKLEIGASAVVNFENVFDNSINPSNLTEALYVGTLSVQAGVTISVGPSAFVYYVELLGSLPSACVGCERILPIPCVGEAGDCVPPVDDCSILECVAGPGTPAQPACRVHDRDADTDVDLFDLALWWTVPH